MRFISCASYYGSGSSAITDFVSEFDTVYSFTDEEFRFVQDPDGVSDLEYNLVENFNRHNSGHAIKRYKKLVDFYCGNMFIFKPLAKIFYVVGYHPIFPYIFFKYKNISRITINNKNFNIIEISKIPF